jgi:anti-anti-sigma factor
MRHDDPVTHAPLVLGSAQLTTTREPARATVVVHVTGEVDVANSALLPDALLDACAADSDGRTELDVSALAFCDLSGARALLEACRRLTISGSCAKMRGASTQLRWLLSFIGAEQDLFDDHPAPMTVSVPHRPVPADRTHGLPGWARREHPVVPRHQLSGTTSPLVD